MAGTRALGRPRRTALWLALLAPSHQGLGLYLGLAGGDFSLMVVDLPFTVLTLLAAALSAPARPWSDVAALVALGLSLVLAILTVPLYGIGLYHLPQSLVALVVAVRATGRR